MQLLTVALLSASAYALYRATAEYTAQRRAEAKEHHPSRGAR